MFERVLKKDIPVNHSLLFKTNLFQDKSCVSMVLEKLMHIQTNMWICQNGASMPQQIPHPAAQSRGFWLALNLLDTHAYITHRDEHVFISCIHIFSLSVSCSHTNTHARAGNQPASRFDTLPVLWSSQWRDGFSYHRLWCLREEEAVCVCVCVCIHGMGEGRCWH